MRVHFYYHEQSSSVNGASSFAAKGPGTGSVPYFGEKCVQKHEKLRKNYPPLISPAFKSPFVFSKISSVSAQLRETDQRLVWILLRYFS